MNVNYEFRHMEHVQGIVEDTENEREVIDNNKYIINKEV
jgi:hypothetical protein